jgi:hypothetical protein
VGILPLWLAVLGAYNARNALGSGRAHFEWPEGRLMRRAKNVWDQKRGVWQPRISEEMVLREIVERLWLQARIMVVRINCPVGGKVRPNVAGIPDLVGYVPKLRDYESGTVYEPGSLVGVIRQAIPLFIEVKRPGGARRVAQERFITEARAAGCAAFFAESWTDVIRELYNFEVKLTA